MLRWMRELPISSRRRHLPHRRTREVGRVRRWRRGLRDGELGDACPNRNQRAHDEYLQSHPLTPGTKASYARTLLSIMKQSIVHVALVVRDYDDAIRFYTEKLKFTVIEDTYQPEQDKRWALIAPPGSDGSALLLARASTPEQERVIGNQTGGRVFLFLSTDDFWRDYS